MDSKKYDGAPFGTQKQRFEVAGIHPKRRPPGTLTQVCYDKKSMSPMSRKLGPGTYNIDNGCFDKKNDVSSSADTGWRRAYETSQEAKIPHLLYREEWEKKQLQKCQLGPGTYDLPDAFDGLIKKPASKLGICQTRAERFRTVAKDVPGPGTYGKGGIPHALMEEKQLKSASTIGMLDSRASGKRQLPDVGSALCPGQYNTKSFIDELNERVISKRGPYDLFTGDRNKPIAVGHLAAPNRADLGPGQYEVKSFLDDFNSEHKKRHGKFGKVNRAPDVPSDRIYCKTLSQWPRKFDEPGPGTYDLNKQIKKTTTNSKHPPFGSSAARNDSRLFSGGNTVGPGRYHLTTWNSKQHKNGNESAFKSNTKRWDASRDKYLMERVRAKDVQSKDKIFLVA
ncbi:ciliary microtubule-associated protein 2-like [Clytia hemisphaerica]|uniref:ciliary microtubule-associated protein 2-like n=1 Tax=Clytia hemisphaerica TaxID=252671 RepID=UPI0034D46E18